MATTVTAIPAVARYSRKIAELHLNQSQVKYLMHYVSFRTEHLRAEGDDHAATALQHLCYALVFRNAEFESKLCTSLTSHSAQCVEQRHRYNEMLVAYTKTYPHYCRHCEGEGFIYHAGCLVSYGSTTARLLPEKEECPSCTAKNLCPRCESSLNNLPEPPDIYSDYFLCPTCGWSDIPGLVFRKTPYEFTYICEGDCLDECV